MLYVIIILQRASSFTIAAVGYPVVRVRVRVRVSVRVRVRVPVRVKKTVVVRTRTLNKALYILSRHSAPFIWDTYRKFTRLAPPPGLT